MGIVLCRSRACMRHVVSCVKKTRHTASSMAPLLIEFSPNEKHNAVMLRLSGNDNMIPSP